MRDTGRRPLGRLCCWVLMMVAASGVRLAAFGEPAPQSGPATTTVADTVYMADRSAAQGSLIITWPAFETASGAAVAAGTTNTTLAANGTFSVALVPNAGATPAGVYYTVVYQLGPGEVKTEYWTVPTASPANLATVRTTPGSGTADAAVSMQYVNSGLATKANDNAVVHLSGTETISGTKTFSAAPSVPAPASSGQVANKGYVDSSVATVGAGAFLPTAGGTMTGPITLPAAPAAPMQAATKQYVDTGLTAKSDLVSGLVPASELGAGSATTGSCLQGNGTSSGTWGACGGGSGTGNLSTTPTASQNIAQPAGTQFSTNNLANIRYVTSNWNWAQTPADNLGTAGSHTIHLSPCPQGLDTTSSANGYTYRVYISGTGTPEAVTVTGGSCPAGTSSGTITVTTAYAHAAGYTVGSASAGIQEAWNDAWVNDQGGPPNANSEAAPYVKLVADTLYSIYSTVYLRGRGGVLDGTGALIACSTRDRCIYVGTTGGVNYHKLYNLSGTSTLNVDGVQVASVSAASGTYTVTTASSHPFAAGDTVDCEYYSQTVSQHFVAQVLAAGLTATQFEAQFGTQSFSAGTNTFGFCNILNTFIENNSDHVTLQDLNLFQANPSTGTGYFSYGVVNDNDQQFIIERAANRGSSMLKNSANWPIGAFVYQRADQGNAGITYLHNSEFTNVNCVTGGGNGMVISDTVCQGFPFFGIRYFGGLQPITIENVYQETSTAVSNPLYGIAAQMGNLVQGGFGSKILGAFPMGGWEPIFVSGGSTQRNYWVVVHSSTQGVGPMMFIGSAQPANGITSIPLQWPSVELQNAYGSLGTVTWDILVTTGGSNPAPYGTGSYAVATGISGSCGTNGMCSYTDTQAATSAYTVATAGFMPVFWFWPVTLVLNNTTVYADFLPSNPFIVASQGTQALAATAGMCKSGNPSFELTPVMVQCLSGDGAYGTGIFATLFQQTAPANNGPAVNSKGRLNLSQAISPPSDLITLADSNLAKTLATAGNRPPNDAGDMAIGVDQTGGMAQRAAASISSYINTTPSGTNWLERLTAAGKTFNVPVAVNGNLAVSGGTVTLPVTGTGSQCLHVSPAGVVSGTGADCGSGSGSVTVNSGVTSQVAMYSGNGTAVSGDSALMDNGTTLNYSGSGGIAATAGAFSGNLTVNGQLLVAGPWTVSSPIPGTAMGPAGAGTSALGISNDGNFYVSANGGTPQKVATSATSSYFSNLTQEDANNLGESNGTTAQNLHVYSSYASSSSWQRTTVGYDATDNVAALRSENSTASQALGIGFMIGSSLRWLINATSELKPAANNSFNIGDPSFAPQTVYAATSFDTLTAGRQNFELCNDATTGTALNFLAKYNGATPACAVKAGTSDTDGAIGIVSNGSGTSGNAVITYRGYVWCSFDGGTTSGDYVVASTTNPGDCHDTGAATRPTGVQVLGRVESSNAVAGTWGLRLSLDAPAATGAAPQASPTFSGTVTLPDGTTDSSSGLSLAAAVTLPSGSVASTQATSDSSTKVATTAYVKNQGYLSSPTGTQGLSLAETTSGAGTTYGTAGAELKCDAGFGGADNAVKIQACINALGSAASGRVDASGFTGSFTVNNNLIPASAPPSGLRVKLGGATIITNVPQILGTRVELEGTGAQGVAGAGMTFFQAGPLFPAGCGANDVNNPSCTGTITSAIASGGTNVAISGTSTKWSSGTTAQTLAPGCTIGIGTFNLDGSIANGAWGVVKAGSTVTDTSITVAVLSVIGTGSSAGASYAKFCDLILTADGSSNPAFGVGVDHIGADCNGVDGCNAFGNYYAEEKTVVHFFQGRGYVNGYLIHNETSGAQNAGDFSEINGGPGSGASANTIDIYDAVNGGSRSKWMLNTITHAVSGACANPPNVAVVLEDLGTEWSNNHQEVCSTSSGIALQVGQNSAVVKAPVFFVQGPVNCHDCSIHNNNLGGNGAQTMVAVSSVTPQLGITVDNNTAETSGATNLLTDGTNTITYACNGGFLGHYETDSYGAPRTDAKSACVTTATVFSNGNLSLPGTLTVGGTTSLGAATATTPSAGNNSTAVATTAYVKNEMQLAWTCPVAGATTSGVSYCNWTLPAGITITQFDLAMSTAPAACTTYPTLQVWDGKANTEVGSYSIAMTSGGTFFYPVVPGGTNLAQGEYLRIKVTTGASGCSTFPAGVVATVTYQMQN
ncbi:MAG: beta strand repeat-containing protein [Candidatus Sulfotelmatobacter sp.]